MFSLLIFSEHREEQHGEHREEQHQEQQMQHQEQHPEQLLQQSSEGGLVVHGSMDVVDNGERQGENPETEIQHS